MKPFTHRLGSVNLPGSSVDDLEDSDNTPQDVSKVNPGLGTSGEVKKGACSFRQSDSHPIFISSA